MTNEWRNRWPLAAALLFLWASVALLVRLSLARTEGHLVYALDDPYIHMAIARHVVQDGVWGVTPYAFSSSSSSLLWTALLAATYRLFGVGELAPLVWNLVFASLALVIADASLGGRLGRRGRFVTLITLVLFTPLPLIVLCGMEHTLHVALTIALAATAAARLGADRAARPPGFLLFVLAALVPLVRYEGLFAVLAVAALFALRGRRRDAALLVAVAVLPLALYGALSVALGWPPLPTSVLLKGGARSVAHALLRLPKNLVKAPGLTVVIVTGLAAFLLDGNRRRWSEDRVLLGLFLVFAWMHVQFASAGWFHRYEGYLKALGIVAIARWLPGWRPPQPTSPGEARGGRSLALSRLAPAALVVALAWGAFEIFVNTPRATQNIYQQQYQMGRFLAAAYPRESVAANDVGAINYLADIHCCDVYGLASLPIARLHYGGARVTSAKIDREVERCGARIAVVYESWFTRGLIATDGVPPRWGAPVARWVIPDNWVCGSDTVAFFALGAGERDTLAARLRAFSPRLPRGVVQIAGATTSAVPPGRH